MLIKKYPSPEFGMQNYVISSSEFNQKHSSHVLLTHPHSLRDPPSPTSSLGHVRSGSMLKKDGSNVLWEIVESPMRALQTACCRASPPTYDCSPAVALATAALDGRLLYFISVSACKHVCLFQSSKLKSSQLTLIL